MSVMSPPDETCRANCRDSIERFLDRSWLLERTPLPAIRGQRTALHLLDSWLQRHRSATLAMATAGDLRAMLQSPRWDEVARHCESLLGLVTRFYGSLRECKFRPDDPVETLIGQELVASASARKAARPRRRQAGALVLSRSPVA